MPNIIGSILRAATRKDSEALRVLTFPTHERYETGLCLTGHQFYAWRSQGIKDWNRTYAPLPANYSLLDPQKGDEQLYTDLDFDFILSQNKFGQFQIAQQLAKQLHLPLISLEHTLPHKTWGSEQLRQLKEMKGNFNVFISEFSREGWGWEESEATVVHHGINSDIFVPGYDDRDNSILSVVNDWINRDWCCGYNIWKRVSDGLPVKVLGDTPGLSKATKDMAELISAYQQSRIFLNTSTVSPVPTVLLEAMACGCAVVSTATCMIPEIIDNGVNGFISNDERELKEYLRLLLSDEVLATRMGMLARQAITNRFSMGKFVENWNTLFNKAAAFVYKG